MNTTPSNSKNDRDRNAGLVGLQRRSNPVAYNPADLVRSWSSSTDTAHGGATRRTPTPVPS